MSKNLYSLTNLKLVEVINKLFIGEHPTPIISKETLFAQLFVVAMPSEEQATQEYLTQIEEEIDSFISDNWSVLFKFVMSNMQIQIYAKSPSKLLMDAKTDKPDVAMHLDFINFEDLEVYNQAFVKKAGNHGK